MKKIIFTLSFVLGVGMGITSCDSYLDINEDPNSPSSENIETDMLMPAIEMNITATYGDFMRMIGGYLCEAYAHDFGTSNYLAYSQFEVSATRGSSAYTQLCQKGLNNLKTVLEMSSEDEDWGTYLAATVLRAFIYQDLIDCWGEIPYTEALDPSNLSPAYDDGQVVYEGVIDELDEALSHVTNSSTVCTNFLYPSSTAGKWIQFANALKLKLLMRMAGVKDVSSQVAALIAEDNFPTEDVSYTGCWSNSSTAMSPFYAEEFSSAYGLTQLNIVANVAVIETMQQEDYTDPRLPAYFDTNSAGEYIGSVSGTNFSTSDNYKYWCQPVVSWDMPVNMITVAEIEFLIAEYYARYGSASSAQEHYNAAIQASFDAAGVEGADEYIARYPYDNSNYKKSLGEQKWVVLCGTNPFEGWCEARRLRYPAFGTATGDDFYKALSDNYDVSSYVPFTLYTPISVFGQVGNNQLLERFPYPESSTARNSNSPSFPGYTSPVFWAK